MTDNPERRPVGTPPEEAHGRGRRLGLRVGTKAARRLRARRRRRRSIWFGLGTFGVIGWSVVVPTLVGLALGVWIDQQWPGRFSWTLMLMLGGLLLGCSNAWYWLTMESRLIEAEEKNGQGEADGD